MNMSSIPVGRREVVVLGDGNCFYRAIARALDGKTERNHSKVRSMCNDVILRFPEVFQPLLFASKTIEGHLEKSIMNGTWAETADIFSCATVLQRCIIVFSMKRGKWMKFSPRVKIEAQMTDSRTCDCPITLVLHDFNPRASHFNLLEPESNCCSAPKPENAKETIFIDSCDVDPIGDEVIFPHISRSQSMSSETKLAKEKKTKTAKKSTTRKAQKRTVPLEFESKANDCKKHMPIKLSKPKTPSANHDNTAKPQTTTHYTAKRNTMPSENKINKCIPQFETMKVKELKNYIQERGVPVSKYKRQDLICLAQSLHEMNAPTDPDFENESIECCLDERLTLPAGRKVSDPFKMANLSSDFSSLPNFGLMDIFNHLIKSKSCYDKEMLASWRSFDEYTLCQNGHVRFLQHKLIFDNDDRKFHVVLAHVIPTQREITQDGNKVYKLWFILKHDGSIYSAFCQCKGGADQGCRHLGAALFELDEFLSSERIAVTSLPAYWNPKPMPETKPLPFLEMKLFHSPGLHTKRNITNYDESWIDSFDPRPTRQRHDILPSDRQMFAEKLKEVDENSGILDYLNVGVKESKDEQRSTEKSKHNINISNLTILSRALSFVKGATISEDNIKEQSVAFVKGLKTSSQERDIISNLTVGQHSNNKWHQFRHLMVTGKKMKGLYTRQKKLEKKPDEDVTKTVKNFLTPSKEMNNYPAAIQHGIEKESEAKMAFSKILKKKHRNFYLKETGLVVHPVHGWVGASPDGIRQCCCCMDTLVEFKCPYLGRDMDPKSAFLLDSVGGAVDETGLPYIRKNHIHYFQVQTGMAVCGLKQCDFVVFTNLGIYMATIYFDEKFWKETINTVQLFYTEKVIPTLLLQLKA